MLGGPARKYLIPGAQPAATVDRMATQRWRQWLRVSRAADQQSASASACRGLTMHDVSWLLVLTVMAFLVLGYHPFAEDGGIYAAAIAHRLQPSLFPWDAEWVEGHTRLSLFVPATAWLLRWLHLPLAWGLLLLQGAGLFATLLAVLLLARASFLSEKTARWATLLFAVSAGLPVAGTALYLVDPYATARTVSTPLLLGAAACMLRRRWLGVALCWVAACAVHPLMAVWGSLPLVLLLASCSGASLRQQRVWWMWIGSTVLLLLGALCWWSPPASPLMRSLALTRGYWFLSAWHWYEVVGAVAPVTLLAAGAALWWKRCRWTDGGRALAHVAWTSALIGVTAALLFAHADGRNFAVARLQPLRTLHLAYVVMLVLVGGSVYELLQRMPARWRAGVMCGVALATGTAMLLSQRALYRSSGVFEWPWSTSRNGWVQAFTWIEHHTSVNDRVALDARYTELAGEDAQGFRAIALRSTLPDAAKDAGIAAVVPALQNSWGEGMRAQLRLNSATDEERIARLKPFGVTWLVLPASSITKMQCPFANAVARVCKLR